MKNPIKPILSLCAIVISMSFQKSDVLCNSKDLSDKADNTLAPYKYDSSELTKILYKSSETVKEVEVPLFIGEKYRFVFEMHDLPKAVEVQIYNKSKDAKNRKLLFSSKDANADKKEFQFEITKAQRVFVDYIIPPTDATSFTGCALLVVGYK